jgi:hypothetical protein
MKKVLFIIVILIISSQLKAQTEDDISPVFIDFDYSGIQSINWNDEVFDDFFTGFCISKKNRS